MGIVCDCTCTPLHTSYQKQACGTGKVPHLFLIHSILIKCSATLKLTFYLLFFFHIVTFGFIQLLSCTCYLLTIQSFTSVSFIYSVARNGICILRDFSYLSNLKFILFSVLTQPSIIDLPKQLQCLSDQTLRFFGEYLATLKQLYQKKLFCKTPVNVCFRILPDQYQPGEKLTCTRFISHSFNLIMSEIKKEKRLSIHYSIGSPSCFQSNSNNSASTNHFCDRIP